MTTVEETEVTQEETPPDLHGLTPIGRELLLEIARQIAILLARRDHEEASHEE
jgi:hypothetical protein